MIHLIRFEWINTADGFSHLATLPMEITVINKFKEK
jgi:hypothetical protein